jgi:hypothetical protein
VRKEHGFVGPLVEHTDVAGIGPGTMTRKHQEQPKSDGHKREGRRHDPLTNASQVIRAGFRTAFANAVTNRHEPHAESTLPQPSELRLLRGRTPLTVTNRCEGDKGEGEHLRTSS